MDFISWEIVMRRGASMECEGTFRDLIFNLKQLPEIDLGDTLHDFFLKDAANRQVWQYKLHASHLSEQWVPFMDLSKPEGTFRRYGVALVPIRNQAPDQELHLHRILVRALGQSTRRLHFGTPII